jgi:hypothetical protein
VFTSRKKEELLSEIEDGFTDKEVYIPRILGVDIIMALQEHGENLKVIVVPSSIYNVTSERVKSYLETARIHLQKGSESAGRPPKYAKDDIKKIANLRNEGVPITQIAKQLNIPRRTVYYLLEKKDQ